MTRQSKQIIRYSISFKQKVVREIEEEGLAVKEASRRYGIKGGQTVQKWISKFGKYHLLNKIIRIETMEEKDRIKELESQIRQLKIALADSTMEKQAMEALIEVVNEHYHTDVKKNLGQQRLKEAKKKKGSR